jgi:hypothetical protein
VLFFSNLCVIRRVCRIYSTYPVLMPFDRIDCMYSLCRVVKFLLVCLTHILKPLKRSNE